MFKALCVHHACTQVTLSLCPTFVSCSLLHATFFHSPFSQARPLEDILTLGSRRAASSSRKLRHPSRCEFMMFTSLWKGFLSGLSTSLSCILLARVSIFFHLAAAYIFYFSNFLGFPQELLRTCFSLPPLLPKSLHTSSRQTAFSAHVSDPSL